jgi:hypothetical protein
MVDDIPGSAYYRFVHWVSVGDLDAAARQFADGAVVVVAPACPIQLPCVGLTAIRYRYLGWIARHASALPIVDQRLEGSTLYAHDRRSYGLAGGPDDAGRYAFRLRDGRITSLTFGRLESEVDAVVESDSQRASLSQNPRDIR